MVEAEALAVSYCFNPFNDTRPMPDGFITSAHYVRLRSRPSSIELTSIIFHRAARDARLRAGVGQLQLGQARPEPLYALLGAGFLRPSGLLTSSLASLTDDCGGEYDNHGAQGELSPLLSPRAWV